MGPTIFDVDLTGQLSNYPTELKKLLYYTFAQVSTSIAGSVARKTTGKHVRLSRQLQTELVARRRSGALQRELAEMYGIHVETVRAVIQRHGPSAPR